MSSLVYLLFVCSITSCFLLTTVNVVNGARVKIVFHKADLKAYQSRVRRAVAGAGGGETACDDRQLIDSAALTSPGGPFAGVNERVKFYRSSIADAGFEVFQRLQVPGLNGSNLADVLQVLREENCNGFFIGGAVRDQFLGRTPRDADIDVNCTIGELVEICVRHWGQSNCRGSAGSPVAHIGNTTRPAPDGNEDDIDLGTARVSFFRTPDNLEYTVNALVYDPNEVETNLILDLPGTGVVDVCNKHIRIPSDDDSEASWDLWRTNRPGYKKLYRAYKLREKTFTYFNSTVLHYITRYSLMGVRSDSEEFSDFLCDEAYAGNYDSEANRCTVTPESDCAGALADVAKYNAAFADDFGSFWESEMLPVTPTSNCELCNLDADPGSCRGYFPSYFFNQTSGRCEMFIYGGCGGNPNRFPTFQTCLKRCSQNRCPPRCTAAFCSQRRNTRAMCTLPDSRASGCSGSCEVTYCHACYYSEKSRDLPGNCATCNTAPERDEQCHRRWSTCIRRANFAQYGNPRQNEKMSENFKCYRHPCVAM